MANSFCLISHFFMSLVILLAFRSPDIEEKFCQIEVFFFTCSPVKLYKAHFDHLVPGGDTQSAPGEVPIDQLRAFQADIQQRVGSGGQPLFRRDGRIFLRHLREW